MSSVKPKIPPINSPDSNVHVAEHYIDFSFAFATSLGVVKRISWEQTPWLLPKISAPDCVHISTLYEVCFNKTISPAAIHNALLLGSTFTCHEEKDNFFNRPQVYVVFPDLERDVHKDQKFLTSWHDEIVLPAFNSAWENSGLVDVWERGTFEPTTPIFHHKMGRQFHEIITRLAKYNDIQTPLREHWPNVDNHYGQAGSEDQNINDRWGIFDDAWKSITGMLEGVPEFAEFQNPFLLLVNKTSMKINPDLEASKAYRIVGQEWDKAVDSRFIIPSSFHVVLQTVIGSVRHLQEDDENDEEPDVGH